jgi:AraC-like DNA-binding protein
MSPFTRELLLHTVDACPLGSDSPVDAALVTLLVDQIAAQPSAPLQLPLPGDDRARQVAEIVLADPAITIDAAASGVGASRRTLERLFRSETQMTLGGWQRRARVLAAIELMADNPSVTRTAALVGYATPSSFVAAFKSELGVPPRVFMMANGD